MIFFTDGKSKSTGSDLVSTVPKVRAVGPEGGVGPEVSTGSESWDTPGVAVGTSRGHYALEADSLGLHMAHVSVENGKVECISNEGTHRKSCGNGGSHECQESGSH